MTDAAPILLFVGDGPVLSSLEFALALEGFTVADGTAEDVDPFAAGCLVVDQGYLGNGIAFLAALRHFGCTTPGLVLVTNPTAALRGLAAAVGAVLIEKPLLGGELTLALRGALGRRETA